MSHYLTQALESLIYYTPKKSKDVMEANLIIKNPPYVIRERDSKNIK